MKIKPCIVKYELMVDNLVTENVFKYREKYILLNFYSYLTRSNLQVPFSSKNVCPENDLEIIK
jgi:hypothetical protein